MCCFMFATGEAIGYHKPSTSDIYACCSHRDELFATMMRNQFINNWAGVSGGAVYESLAHGSTMTFDTCKFIGNSANAYGHPVGDDVRGYGGGFSTVSFGH